jgi:hypothetical protein
MSRDPIVDEVRAIRDAIAREHSYDLDSIFHMLRDCEAESGRRHVILPPRPVEADKAPKGPAGAAQSGATSVRRASPVRAARRGGSARRS